jgi:hypothetical protein
MDAIGEGGVACTARGLHHPISNSRLIVDRDRAPILIERSLNAARKMAKC